jgi:hypothetical protein
MVIAPWPEVAVQFAKNVSTYGKIAEISLLRRRAITPIDLAG